MNTYIKTKTFVISVIILAALNIITLGMIWSAKIPFREKPPGNKGHDPIEEKMNFDDSQKKKHAELREEYLRESNKLFDSLSAAKREFNMEIFKNPLDSQKVNILAAKLSDIEVRLEKQRFDHFRRIMEICSPDQKEKLKGVLEDMFMKMPWGDRPENNGVPPPKDGPPHR